MKRFTLVVGIALLAACSVGLAGCTHHAPSDQPKDQGAAAYIMLQNVRPDAYQLYITDGNRRLDVGKIGALESVRIQVPPELVYPGARLALVAQPTLGSRNGVIPFTIHPGATIRLMLGR
ncbi:MAG TPA: hypothetical protein VJR24_03660 [Gemmatimonadaceae bacterium]|nr:hypothetical protein [Gemmatimonadaceae bacterium]